MSKRKEVFEKSWMSFIIKLCGVSDLPMKKIKGNSLATLALILNTSILLCVYALCLGLVILSF